MIRVVNIINGEGPMKTFVMGGIAAALFFSAADCASAGSTTSPSAQKQVSDAQKQVDKAKADLDDAKEKAEAGMAPSDKAEWQKAESKFENLVTSGNDSKQASAQKGSLKELDSRVVKSSDDRDAVEDARNKLVVAQTKLNVINSRLRNAPDDSSQATQPENRTQNGAGFRVRSERDAENHPPLPASN
jgi:hypothetical protein